MGKLHRLPRLGDIYLVNFPQGNGGQTGMRPALVFQNNVGNLHSSNVIVLPLTSNLSRDDGQLTHVLVRAEDTNLKLDSVVLCECPQCIPIYKLDAYITKLSREYLEEIAIAFMYATGAIGLVNLTKLKEINENCKGLIWANDSENE